MEQSERTPVSISRDGDSVIVITWTDGSESRWSAAQLRAICPCATCREKKRGVEEKQDHQGPKMLPVLSSAEARPLKIEAMRPVGAYAYNIAFSDGHHSGIFPLQLLEPQS